MIARLKRRAEQLGHAQLHCSIRTSRDAGERHGCGARGIAGNRAVGRPGGLTVVTDVDGRGGPAPVADLVLNVIVIGRARVGFQSSHNLSVILRTLRRCESGQCGQQRHKKNLGLSPPATDQTLTSVLVFRLHQYIPRSRPLTQGNRVARDTPEPSPEGARCALAGKNGIRDRDRMAVR